jgi:AraC family transcriptional regulator of adaptative response/methylated-DNA-[protein]-cysteine methyltransferase
MDTNIPDMIAETIRFGYGETTLGLVLVALSDLGVAAILLGDNRQALRREFADDFPEARLVKDQAGLEPTVARVVALVDARQTQFDLPLDLRGSPTELAVWEALQGIPSGETRSYGAIAKMLPVTATAQDVGAACAANRIAVAVPCHRVVKADGSISGYRWGVRRKRRLINMEGIA